MTEVFAKLQSITAQVGVNLLVQFSDLNIGAAFQLDQRNYEFVRKTIQVEQQALLGWEVVDSSNNDAWGETGQNIAEDTDLVKLLAPLLEYHLKWKVRQLLNQL